MKINEVKYTWRNSLPKRSKTTAIILHHRAGEGDAMSIHNLHLNNGWSGIGYHYYVRKDGSIYRGRPENTVGAHAGDNNNYSIGICFEGNFEKESMCDKQIKAGAELVADIRKRYPTIAKVIRHKDVNSTSCPGKNFPFEKIANGTSSSQTTSVNLVKKFQTAAIADGYKLPKYGADGIWGSESESVAKKAIVKKRLIYTNKNLTKLVQGLVGISVDGKCGNNTDRAIRAYQKKSNLTVDGAVGLNTWKRLLGVK